MVIVMLIRSADKESVKKFREDLTSLGTVYINDAYVPFPLNRGLADIVASEQLTELTPPWSASNCPSVPPDS